MTIREACAKIADLWAEEKAAASQDQLGIPNTTAALTLARQSQCAGDIAKTIRAMPIPAAMAEEREELARAICEANGYPANNKVVWGPNIFGETKETEQWRRFAKQADALLAAGWRRA